ncbi:MAG TPA: heme exporter protein CcmB [Fimbriimonadaceae bacterium]|nr:heme exporter protein CcmB [Fimbriimonadaceae bacterium]
MNSSWRTEILAVLRKEAQVEWRTRSGLMTAGLFGLAATAATTFAAMTEKLTPGVISALLWITLLFAATVWLPRAFLVESEQGTTDLLRLLVRPHALFWGKALFNLVSMSIGALGLAALLLLLVGAVPTQPFLFVVCLVSGIAALSGTMTLCGALAVDAGNRFLLAGAISVPLLIPLLAIAVAGTGASFEVAASVQAVVSAVGLVCYAVATFALGPHIFAAVWKI